MLEADLCTHPNRVSPQTPPVCGDNRSGRSATSRIAHSQASRRFPSLQDNVSVRRQLLMTSLNIFRCENCGYYCTLPFGAFRSWHFHCRLHSYHACTGHPQQEHETSHGSMSKTRWAVDGPDGEVLELNGRKFSSNDDGAPMLVSHILAILEQHFTLTT
jgi:hypothetical protein